MMKRPSWMFICSGLLVFGYLTFCSVLIYMQLQREVLLAHLDYHEGTQNPVVRTVKGRPWPFWGA